MKKHKKTKISLLVIIGAIAIAEIFLRFNSHEQLKEQKYPLLYQPDSIGYRYIPNTTTYDVSPGYDQTLVTNNQGFISENFNLEKDSTQIRIMHIEYSWAFDGKFAQNVRAYLKKNGFRNIEFINCSIDGDGLNFHHYNMIKYDLLKYNPDIILYRTNIPFNREDRIRECYRGYVLEYSPDSILRKKCMYYVDNIYKHKALCLLYDKSYIIRAICKKIIEKYEWEDSKPFVNNYMATYKTKKMRLTNFNRYQYTTEGTIKKLKELKGLLDKINCKLILFQQIKNDYVESKFEPLLKANGLDYIILDITPEYYYINLTRKNDGHPSEYGYNYMAEKLFEKFTNHDYLKK